MTPTRVPRQWEVLARDAVHWRPPRKGRPPALALPRRGVLPTPEPSPVKLHSRTACPDSPSSPGSPGSDSSLSSLSSCSTSGPEAEHTEHGLPTPASGPPSSATSGSGVLELACGTTGADAYLTPSPSLPSAQPSLPEQTELVELEPDPTDAYLVYADDDAPAAAAPPPQIKHMWTSPMHPPELRFLTLQNGSDQIYALVGVQL